MMVTGMVTLLTPAATATEPDNVVHSVPAMAAPLTV